MLNSYSMNINKLFIKKCMYILFKLLYNWCMGLSSWCDASQPLVLQEHITQWWCNTLWLHFCGVNKELSIVLYCIKLYCIVYRSIDLKLLTSRYLSLVHTRDEHTYTTYVFLQTYELYKPLYNNWGILVDCILTYFWRSDPK